MTGIKRRSCQCAERKELKGEVDDLPAAQHPAANRPAVAQESVSLSRRC